MTLYIKYRFNNKKTLKNERVKLSCHIQFPHAFTTLSCVFQVLALVGQNKLTSIKTKRNAIQKNTCVNGMLQGALKTCFTTPFNVLRLNLSSLVVVSALNTEIENLVFLAKILIRLKWQSARNKQSLLLRFFIPRKPF